MAWSNDMRCLYCDGKLPLYRKITNGQFCSTAHRKAYWQDQQQLALERLHQTHTSLRAVLPPVPAESILGPECPEVTVLSGFLYDLRMFPQELPLRMADHLDVWETEFGTSIPAWTTPRNLVLSLPDAGLIRLMRLWLERNELGERDFVPEVYAQLRNHLRTVYAVAPRMPRPSESLQSGFAPITPEIESRPEAGAPPEAWLLLLGLFQERDIAVQLRSGASPLPASIAISANPRLGFVKLAGLNSIAGLVGWTAVRPITASAPYQPRIAAIHAAPQVALGAAIKLLSNALLLGDPSFRSGKGCRYPVQPPRSLIRRSQADPVDFLRATGDLALPVPPAIAPPPPPDPLDQRVPDVLGMVPLAYRPGPPVAKAAGPLLSEIATIPQPLQTEPSLPAPRLAPVTARPASQHFPVEEPVYSVPSVPWRQKAESWAVAVSSAWQQAPRDLKLLAFAIPALLALAFHGNLPKVGMSAPSSSGQLGRNVENVVNAQLTTVRQAMMERAAVALDEDFRSGLDDWTNRGDATAGWSFDAAGFVRPGPLALYRPSMNLTDYQLQFLGMIDKKALSWVVRAADFDNYYVLKLVVLKPGPLTTIGLTRYAVINGKAQNRVDTPVVMDAQPDTLYRVRLDVDGDDFSLGVQGQMIDSWTEPRLPHGGVGFFTARGEESRVRWIAITHQYDMLGRLCAYLAPYEIPTTNGSW